MSRESDSPRRVLVVVPNWVGDVVLATPVFAAMRERWPDARITYLMRRYVGEIVEGGGWHDAAIYWPDKRAAPRRGLWSLIGEIRAGDFDLGVLLTNSFRSALALWMGRARRRAGYARDARTLLLTERLHPPKQGGRFVPHPMLDYYSRLAERVGCPVADRRLRLGVTPEQERQGTEIKSRHGFGDGPPYAVVNPGAAFGAAKCWLPERFSQVCDSVAERWDMLPVVVGSPGEAPLMRAIAQGAKTRVICCEDPGTTLGSLKPIVRDAALLVCNDTGPRHYGNAFGVPTVTIFGPTFQEWTDTDYAGETKLQVKVECGPCMLRSCPIDHRCMKGVTTDMVLDAAGALLSRPVKARLPA